MCDDGPITTGLEFATTHFPVKGTGGGRLVGDSSHDFVQVDIHAGLGLSRHGQEPHPIVSLQCLVRASASGRVAPTCSGTHA